MDSDPLTSFLTPPSKRRKVSMVKPSPPRLSDLLSAFGARRVPSSVSRMEKEADSRDLRPVKQPFNYAESEGSNLTPKTSPGASSFEASPESSKTSIKVHDSTDSENELQQDDEDELQSDDIIHGQTYTPTAQIICLLTNAIQPSLAHIQSVSFQRDPLERMSATQPRRSLPNGRKFRMAENN